MNIEFYLSWLIICIFIAGAAFTWSEIVTQEGQIFGFIRKIKMPWWLKKALYECHGCVSGWWTLIMLSFHLDYLNNGVMNNVWTAMTLAIFTFFTMFLSWLISKIQIHL